MDRTRRSSMLFTDRKSRLLWRTCVTAAAAELFITRPPSIAAHEVFPSMEEKWKGVKRLGVVDGARYGPGNNNLTVLNNFNGRDLLEIKR